MSTLPLSTVAGPAAAKPTHARPRSSANLHSIVAASGDFDGREMIVTAVLVWGVVASFFRITSIIAPTELGFEISACMSQ
jgi:hypothetical protein